MISLHIKIFIETSLESVFKNHIKLIQGRISMLDSNWAVAISHFEKAVKLGTLKSNDMISANIELSEAYR